MITEELNNELIDTLENYTAKHSLRKYELAHILGTTEATISRWFTRKHKISKAYVRLIQQKLAD